ncbi:MAG TPA: alcohol dehydrogenase catalytic domain-containing protein [Ktedonobacteraceae bacterium]|jgi:L-iditol 2-dehydrogenase|nr:alcohol dehydrogenase catalytic domain-containing protein [Ktedonobacteraceae bacterium]
MLAAMFYGPLDLRLEERAIPQVGPGEVLLQVAAATTCGTDVKAYRRGHPVLFRQFPAGFGHEVAGVVAACGRGVTQCREGDAVVVANSAPCLRCFYCRRGRYNLCEDLLFLNGAYAEYLLVPERIVRQNVYILPARTSFVAAALTEPLACALHGVEASQVVTGDTVVVVGSGPLGLLLTALAKLRGAHVVLTGRGEQRLALGRRFGAERVIDVGTLSLPEQCEVVRSNTEGQRGADVVIEAVGTPATWEQAAKMVRPGGQVTFFGGCPSGTQVTLETQALHYSEITTRGVFHFTPAHFAQSLDYITGGHIEIEDLVTARVPLSSALEVMQQLLQKQGVKYALIPPTFAHALLNPSADPA